MTFASGNFNNYIQNEACFAGLAQSTAQLDLFGLVLLVSVVILS